MSKNFFTNKKYVICVAIIHWLISFYTDHFVFEALSGQGIVKDFLALGAESRIHYFVCKVVLFVLIYKLWEIIFAIFKGVVKKDRECLPVVEITKYSLIYLIPILAVLVFKLPQGFLSNDETLIFAEASALNTYTWFYYLTTYYYIVTMMLIPSWLGPILVKVFLQVAICGYCVYRLKGYFKDRWAYGIYIAFLLPPVLAYTTSAHRIPVYYLLYLLLCFVLVMDRQENKTPDKSKLFWIMVCGAVLTQWRTEGIYMLLLLLILIFVSYPSLSKGLISKDRKVDKLVLKRCLTVIAASLIIQYVFTIPQNGIIADRLGDQADNRMGPFWAYTVTNMYRNGLDLEKNKTDMEKIWRYLDKGTLQSINDDLGDINYEDVLILYYEGYTGKIETATPDDYNQYVEGCKSLFVNNLAVFIRTRIGAFKYAAMPYRIQWTQGGLKGFVLFLVSIVKTLAYNLFIPCLLVIVFEIYALVKRKWQWFLIMSGLICHWFIVFILAPASYFKYYFPIYMLGYFATILSVVFYIRKKRKER